MNNSKFLGSITAGIGMTLLGMTAIVQLLARPLIRCFDVSEDFVGAVTGIMMLMGIIATLSFVIWIFGINRKMEHAVNPGLVNTRCGSALGATLVASAIVYGILAIVNIGLSDWGALGLSTLIGAVSAAVAAGLLYLAMQFAINRF